MTVEEGVFHCTEEQILDLKAKACQLIKAAEEFHNDINGASFDLQDAQCFWDMVREHFKDIDDHIKDMIETDESYVEEEE